MRDMPISWNRILMNVQMSWNTTPLSLLNTYRVSHHLSTPAAFTSPLNQALLSNPGIGRQSPTMARRKDKRRVSKEQLATNVRKHFNGAAVNEIDVVVELVYKSRNKGKAESPGLPYPGDPPDTAQTRHSACALPPASPRSHDYTGNHDIPRFPHLHTAFCTFWITT